MDKRRNNNYVEVTQEMWQADYNKYYRLVWKIAKKIGGDDEDLVEELVAHGFLHMKRIRELFNPEFGVKYITYLYRALRNDMQRFKYKQIYFTVYHDTQLIFTDKEPEISVKDEEIDETNEILTKIGEILDDREFYIFIELVINETKLKDIGSKLKISRERVRQIHLRSLKKIEQFLDYSKLF